ncbi:MAG: hypothetical protein HYR74_05445 [Candidatus Eisenbacteria bacterium]|nr:hypothetical protein [Candidatus Eisenbacteria bacterium]
MRRVSFVLAAALAALLITPAPAPATDVDGPDDCGRWIDDFGDAHEGIPAYPSGVIGRFPTCIIPGLVGTQTSFCPPISTAPGPTGYVHHMIVVPSQHYWLGCYGTPAAALGIDSDGDGKVNTPPAGSSTCAAGLATDCVQAAWGMSFDQDECYGDGSDAGLLAPPALVTCFPATISYNAYNACPTPASAYLNILIDMNGDGDWNDNLACGTSCAYEWAVRNVPIALAVGCNAMVSPSPSSARIPDRDGCASA